MNENPTLFDILSRSPQDMAKFLAERAVYSPCEFICHGKCSAIGSFNKSTYKICLEKIIDFPNRPIGGDIE